MFLVCNEINGRELFKSEAPLNHINRK